MWAILNGVVDNDPCAMSSVGSESLSVAQTEMSLMPLCGLIKSECREDQIKASGYVRFVFLRLFLRRTGEIPWTRQDQQTLKGWGEWGEAGTESTCHGVFELQGDDRATWIGRPASRRRPTLSGAPHVQVSEPTPSPAQR